MITEKPSPQPNCPEGCRVTNHIPMVHVVDVDKSVGFYAQLGFGCDSQFSGPDGRTNWASLSSERAHIMLTRASGPVDARQQAVLFYMYSRDVMALRVHLMKCGLTDGGKPPSECEPGGRDTPMPERNAVFRPTFPFYMAEGEVRIHDLDGYCILVGQLER
jgi:hypothetical protein